MADFHATRHTFISNVVASGASVKTAQELARHSTPTLTIGRYAHTRLHDVVGALESLPNQTTPETSRQTLRATGTDDATAENGALQLAQQSGRETRQSGATGCDDESDQDDNATAQRESPKPLQIADLGDDVRPGATADKERRARDSNPQSHTGHLISNPTPLPENSGKNGDSQQGVAQDAAVDAENSPIDADLASIIDAWPDLPAAVKAGILAMVRAAT